ncbi:MAG TPA: hypothetical protein VN805_14895 [Caulobacteraceae bacterium]|nr:hypothetical protein [Caulobacteraceae bacterium]
MHTFKVVKEHHGWAVRLGDGMCTPFWSRAQAIREANRLCEALRMHGVSSEVVVEVDPDEPMGASRTAALGGSGRTARTHDAWR